MSRTGVIALAAGGSAALLLAAYGFQYLGDMAPCQLCYWQRYGHMAAIVAGLGAVMPLVGFALLGLAGAGASAALGLYHTGVERAWWPGPSSCSSQSIDGLSTQELLDQIMAAPLVRCDEVPWALAGLSMASWNALASLVLVGVWIAALRARV